MIETKTVYFEEKGPGNTDDTLQLARERAEALVALAEMELASRDDNSGTSIQ